MGWLHSSRNFFAKHGNGARTAAKHVLSAALPGGSVVAEVVDRVLGAAHSAAKSAVAAEKEAEEVERQAKLVASAEELERVGKVLDELSGRLAPLVEKVAALNDRDEIERQIRLDLTTDSDVRDGLRAVADLAGRFDALERQNREILARLGYGQDILETMVEMMRRQAVVVNFVEEMIAEGVHGKQLGSLVQQIQSLAHDVTAKPAEVSLQLEAFPGERASAAVLELSAVSAVLTNDLARTDRLLGEASRKRPADAGLRALHARATVAFTRGHTPAAPSRAAVRQPKAGDTLDGWKLELILGRGGWGQVFRAVKGEQTNALKVMHAELSRDPAFVQQFKREMRTLMRLDAHPNLVAIDDFGHCPDFRCWYFVMPFIGGQTLDSHLAAHGPLTPVAARRMFAGLADGLAVAHACGTIHRDIKPANVIVTPEGKAVVVDFGIAGQQGVAGHTKAAGYDALFASPEQIRTGAADARSDVYSLAATLYFALKYNDAKVREPQFFKPKHAPELFRDLLAKSLDNDPDERPADGRALKDAFPSEVVVCAAGTGDYLEIADAVQVAELGATIRVKPGTYRKTVTLSRKVELLADGPREQVVIEGAIESRMLEGTVRGFTVRNLSSDVTYAAIHICAGRVVVEDCDIASGYGVGVAIQNRGTAPTVRGCTIRDGMKGVHVYDGAAGLVEDCQISGSTLAGVNIAGAGTTPTVRYCTIHEGVFVHEGAAGLIEGCRISSRHTAVTLSGAGTAPTVRGCTICGGKSFGVFVTGGAGMIEGCQIYGQERTGVRIAGAGTAPTVRDCTIRDGKEAGVWVFHSAAGVIENCQIHGNERAGVEIDGPGTAPTVRGCTITRNKYHAVSARESAQGTVENCDLKGNEKGPWLIDATAKVERRGNKE